jgi:hypothetical protein
VSGDERVDLEAQLLAEHGERVRLAQLVEGYKRLLLRALQDIDICGVAFVRLGEARKGHAAADMIRSLHHQARELEDRWAL